MNKLDMMLGMYNWFKYMKFISLIDQVEIINVQNMLLDALRYENLITF